VATSCSPGSTRQNRQNRVESPNSPIEATLGEVRGIDAGHAGSAGYGLSTGDAARDGPNCLTRAVARGTPLSGHPRVVPPPIGSSARLRDGGATEIHHAAQALPRTPGFGSPRVARCDSEVARRAKLRTVSHLHRSHQNFAPTRERRLQPVSRQQGATPRGPRAALPATPRASPRAWHQRRLSAAAGGAR
jgi:hypothetical protein